MSFERVPSVVIGAGVVGCAVAHALAVRGRAPWLLDRDPRPGTGITSRNSGVIHAGLYYPPDSLRAASCVRGAALLYEWCAAHEVAHRRCGKWVVAAPGEEEALEALHDNALASGATGLRLASGAEVEADEPGVRAAAGLFSANTGIVDPHELTRSLWQAAQERGATLVAGAAVTGLEPLAGGGWALDTTRGEVHAELVVNAAGLAADHVAALAGIPGYRIHPCRGDYFRVSSRHRFGHLVYPVRRKGAPGLGVHVTLALDGGVRLGPDAYYVEARDVFTDPADPAAKRRAFFEAASRYLRGLREDELSYDGCGIRPKLRAPTGPEEIDFVVSLDRPGFVNLVGIESPGLTASLALAEKVVALL